MLTSEELKAKAQKYAQQTLTRGQSADVLGLLQEQYVQGFMQGFTCAGGIVGACETGRCECQETPSGV